MTCTNLPYAVSQIQQISNGREVELNQAQGLSEGQLQNGGALKSDLTMALLYSLKADEVYLRGAKQLETACNFGSQPNAGADDARASTYKMLFARLWNPIASLYGLPRASAATM